MRRVPLMSSPSWKLTVVSIFLLIIHVSTFIYPARNHQLALLWKRRNIAQFQSTGCTITNPCDIISSTRSVSSLIDNIALQLSEPRKSILATSMEDLGTLIEGKGKAKMTWDDLREGINPLLGNRLAIRAKAMLCWLILSSPDDTGNTQGIAMEERRIKRESWARRALSLLYTPHIGLSCLSSNNNNAISSTSKVSSENVDSSADCETTLSLEIAAIRSELMLITQAATEELISNEILKETLSPCGTRKMLLRLTKDDLEIESVLIPSTKYDRTTLCVSTQVGCDRGCAFCLTGKMGLIRNLTSTEIIGQVVRGLEVSRRTAMPAMTNIVFMGMGDAGRNIDAVRDAVACITDTNRLRFAHQKVTVSTVGPSPDIFEEIAKMNCTIAWSLHSANETIRQRLVYSSRPSPNPSRPYYSIQDLRQGLLNALKNSDRSRRKQSLMIALTLIDGVNDSIEDAEQLAEFILPMLQVCRKIAIDLIPYNEIDVMRGVFKRPTRERVNAFQAVLRDKGLFCSVRLTRGDEENSACGMLATSKRPIRTRRPQI